MNRFMNFKTLKIAQFLKIPKFIIILMFLILIGTIIVKFSSYGGFVLEQKSQNPESIIPPVETEKTTTNPADYINKVSYAPMIRFNNIIYNWQDIFDIFVSNPESRNRITSPNLEKLSLDVKDPQRKFYPGSSDQILADYGDVIKQECSYYKLDWRLVLGIIKQESAFTSDAVSHAGAYGFMQIMPKTGSMLESTLNIEDHTSPKNNLIAGIYYYANLVGRYDGAGDPNKYKFALAAYNAGSGHVEDAMTLAYYNNENYLDWEIVKEYMKKLAPGNDSLHQLVWKSHPPNGVFANWKEPYNYVDNIIYYWGEYKRIYPLPEDNLKKQKTKKKKNK